MKINNKLIRRAIAAILGVALLCGTAIAASTITTKTIEANYMGIQIVVDGAAVTPKDANGNVVEPFVSEGTTYLPVRAIGEALGKEVTWDGDTRTVYIGQVPGTETNWMTKLPPYQVNERSKVYDGTDPKSTFTVGGVTKTSGVVLYPELNRTAYAMWNTNVQYRTMTFTVAHSQNITTSSYSDVNATLEVYLDGNYSTSYDLQWDGGPQTITIPLNYAANVKLELGTSDNVSFRPEYSLYDISFSE